MKLNYRLRTSKEKYKTTPVIMIHGLFGNLTNLGSIAEYLSQNHDVIQVDLRNHGHSPRRDTMNYTCMAQDILELLNCLLIKKCIVIGHSIGGKVAMALSILGTHYIDKIVILDIAPIKYNHFENQSVLKVIDYIDRFKIQNKHDVINIMRENFIKQNIISFLLKSLHKGSWSFHFQYIKKNFIYINDWSIYDIWKGPALFIKGSSSSYITELCTQKIYNQFPNAAICTVPNSGHWVHYDNPKYVSDVISKFI